MSIISCTSPRPSWAILPVSSVTSAPSASFSRRSSSPSSRTSSPRRGAGTSRQRLEGRAALRDGGVGAGGVAARDAGEQLAGDGRAHLEIAVRERGAIESEPLEDVVDGEHGVPPSGRRRGPDDVIVP